MLWLMIYRGILYAVADDISGILYAVVDDIQRHSICCG